MKALGLLEVSRRIESRDFFQSCTKKPILGLLCYLEISTYCPRQGALKLEERVFDVASRLKDNSGIVPVYTSSLGALFSADCMMVLARYRGRSH